jgi:phage baseplate assembly protein W
MAITISSVTYGSNLSSVTSVIDLPFNISSSGKVATIPDSDHKAWRNKVLTLLSVDVDERIWYHNFGVNLNSFLFENSSSALVEMRGVVAETFIKWAPELTFKELDAFYDSTVGTITVNIIYQIPTGEVDSVKIVTETLTAAGEIVKGI